MMRRVLPLAITLFVVGSCGDKNPTGPSPQLSASRIISLEGDLNFGNVDVNTQAARTLVIRNSGGDTLTVTGMSASGDGEAFRADWTSGSIPAGGAQSVRILFEPTVVQHYLATLRVNGNQTEGVNTTQMSGFGIRTGPLWTMSGTGNTVFDMPGYVARVRIRGAWNRRSNSNFIVRIGGRLAVNEILRETITYEGVHLTNGGGTVEIVSSNNINWTFTEER